MKSIEINGQAYPVHLSIGAMVAYKQHTGEDFSQFKGDDMEKLGVMIFFALKSGARKAGIDFQFARPEEIFDFITLDDVTALFGADRIGVQALEEAKKNGASPA